MTAISTPLSQAVDQEYSTLQGKGWDVADKIFGYMGLGTEIYGDVKMASLYGMDPYASARLGVYPPTYGNIGILGMPRPYGGLVLAAGIALGVLLIFKIASK